MEDQISERIYHQLNKATRPCEIGLVIAVVGLPGSRAEFLPERLSNFIKNWSLQDDLPFDEKIPVIPYFKQGRIKLYHYILEPDADLDLRVRSLLRSCDGIILQLDKADPILIPGAKKVLDRVLTMVLDRRKIAVFASTRTVTSKLEKSRIIAGLDLHHTQERDLDSLHVFGPYEKEKDGYTELMGWIGDLLEEKQYSHSVIIENAYIYDEAGLPVILLETSKQSKTLEPTLLTAMYRALEALFFEQRGAIIRSLSLEEEGEQDLTLAAIRYKDLAVLLFIRGPSSKSLIWQIGTYILIGVKHILPKTTPGASMMMKINADSIFSSFQPHAGGHCDKCKNLQKT